HCASECRRRLQAPAGNFVAWSEGRGRLLEHIECALGLAAAGQASAARKASDNRQKCQVPDRPHRCQTDIPSANCPVGMLGPQSGSAPDAAPCSKAYRMIKTLGHSPAWKAAKAKRDRITAMMMVQTKMCLSIAFLSCRRFYPGMFL